MTLGFHELLLSELRMVVYQPDNPAEITDKMLVKAVTLNENIRSLGYVLRPDDMLLLSGSPSLEGFFDHLKSLVPNVKAQPMYPGFPQQVMEMSEAEFRFHQLLHYFSTYGAEQLLGENVSRGWLPKYPGPERTEKDDTLLESKVIELIDEKEAPIQVMRLLMNRRERMTNPELSLVLECAPLCTAEQLRTIKVRFKENLELLFPMLMAHEDRATALKTLRAVCAHTGDVLECIRKYLHQRKYHLTTSEKKLLVRLLEAYPVNNLRTNLIQSQRMREKNLLALKHLDYNRFSGSKAHAEAVRALRNSELLSWHSTGEALISSHSPEALAHFAQRPGYMVRMINRLLSLDYTAEEITQALLPRSGAISAHLIVKTLRAMLKFSAGIEERYQANVLECRQKYDLEQCSLSNYSWDFYRISDTACIRRKNAEEMCLINPVETAKAKIKEETNKIRQRLKMLEDEILVREKTLMRLESGELKRSREGMYHNANHSLSLPILYTRLHADMPGVLKEEIDRLKEEFSHLSEEACMFEARALVQLSAELKQIQEEGNIRYANMLEEIDAWEQDERARLQERIESENAEYAQRMRTLPKRKAAELEQLKEQYEREKKLARLIIPASEILKTLLRAHFQQVVTPLKGKKVFIDMNLFDLKHSVLETEDRSKDGGYIRSGISYKIPENAKYVRFFVYWNDPSRVDIDLHAGGLTMNGNNIHIGWNSDFRNSGVVHSGDITHSNAAEYIDIDLSAPIREIYTNVNLFNGFSFKNIQTCYVGMMAVNKNGQSIRHYDPANCFFTHRLTQKTNNLYYGFIDVQNRFVRFVGQVNSSSWDARPSVESEQAMFSLREYLDSILQGQDALEVSTPEEADVVLTMGKSLLDAGISLADNNFFLEC